MKTFEIGQEVVRSKGDYVVGRVGSIIEIDDVNKRARVEWIENPRSWVKFDSLELTSIPYKIHLDQKVKGKARYPKYIRM